MWAIFFIGLALTATAFALLWALCVRISNYGFVDVAWSYGIAVLAPLYAWKGTGLPLRKAVFAGVGIVWSLRLGTYLLLRVSRHHPQEDVRYRSLRAQWASPALFLGFFEAQAITVAIFSLPFLFACFNPAPSLNPLEIAGLSVVVLSICGEALSDWQMGRFKADPASRGKVCRAGLWRYSRHPNYFFESMVWWGFFLAALGSPGGAVTVICPALMLYFLFRVTGIPLTEKHALESKGDAYREYQRTTSAFVPFFPRKNESP